jgi:hypothetical protein
MALNHRALIQERELITETYLLWHSDILPNTANLETQFTIWLILQGGRESDKSLNQLNLSLEFLSGM